VGTTEYFRNCTKQRRLSLWLAEVRPLGKKWLRGGRRRKLHCVTAFNEQSAKAIFQKTPTQPNWLIT
jgi:hypothetical protein